MKLLETVPSWQKLFNEAVEKNHGNKLPAFKEADEAFKLACQEWMDRLTDEEVLLFNRHLIEVHGEFEKNLWGIMRPNTHDRIFNFRVLNSRLSRIGIRENWIKRTKAAGHKIHSEKHMISSYMHQGEDGMWIWVVVKGNDTKNIGKSETAEQAERDIDVEVHHWIRNQ